MSTAYQPTMTATYDNHAVHPYSASMAHAARSKASAMVEMPPTQYSRYSQPVTASSQYQSQRQQPSHAVQQPIVRQSSRPVTPKTEPIAKKPKNAANGASEELIFHSLRIPQCISLTGGDLADFAAQMTCLFWFEPMDDLKQAETIRSRPTTAPIPRLPQLAKPLDQFRKWVFTVLSTTQVTQNVVLLALLFIYRLRRSTPSIKGRGGSEYRLLTVALMLGNKFLDDNTYTNKTWAEVSSFGVTEIHVMEVEFLSNMRYNLLASADEWEAWLVKLSCFHEYYQRALRLPPSPMLLANSTGRNPVSPLASPTAVSHSDASEAFSQSNYSPSSSQGQSQNWANYQPNHVSPLASKPALNLPAVSRKRGHEDESAEHPAKRAVPARLTQLPSDGVSLRQNSVPAAEPARLPQSNLMLANGTNMPAQRPATVYSTPTGHFPPQVQTAPPSQPHVSLPPLQTGMRAMASVYHPTPPSSIVPASASVPVTTPAAQTTAPTSFPGPILPSHQNFGTPTKRHSPGSLAPFASSPMADPFGQVSAVHTPLAHTPLANSPSVYLQHRNSPYKPIRHVNTLLHPASASLDQYHLSVPLQPTQMHYQPLGRRNDLRTGVVPEYILYNRGQHLQHAQQMQHPQQQAQPPQPQQVQQLLQAQAQHQIPLPQGMQQTRHYPS